MSYSALLLKMSSLARIPSPGPPRLKKAPVAGHPPPEGVCVVTLLQRQCPHRRPRVVNSFDR